jgi:hypothetical protein
MRAESGKNGFETRAEVLPRGAGQLAGAGVSAALIGRDNKNSAAVSERCKGSGKQFIQLFRRKIGIGTSRGAIETHAANPASLGTIVEQRCPEQLPGMNP